MTDQRNAEPAEPVWDAADPMESFRHHGEFLHQKAKWMFLKDKACLKSHRNHGPHGRQCSKATSHTRNWTIIGPHNVGQLRVHLLTERFEIAGFLGKTLLCGKDVPGDFLDNRAAHVIKPLTGGDRLSAEQKNVKHRFEVVGDFAVIITTNSRLHVRLDSDTEAWRRRMLIIDFTQPPTTKPIPHFARELVRTEGPGILNWCIDGAVRLLDELREHGRIQLTQAQKQRVDALLCESDSVRHFVTHCVTVNPTGDVTVSELLTAYNAFCASQGWQAVTVRQFESQVCDHMVSIHHAHKRTDIERNDKNQRGYARVSLQDASPVSPAPEPAQSGELPF